MMDDQMKRTGILRQQSSQRYLKRANRQSRLRRRGCRLRRQHVQQPKGHHEGRLISMRRCTRSGTHCSKRLALESHWWRRGKYDRQDRSPLLVSEATGLRWTLAIIPCLHERKRGIVIVPNLTRRSVHVADFAGIGAVVLAGRPIDADGQAEAIAAVLRTNNGETRCVCRS